MSERGRKREEEKERERKREEEKERKRRRERERKRAIDGALKRRWTPDGGEAALYHECDSIDVSASSL